MEFSSDSTYVGQTQHGRGVFAKQYFFREDVISEIYGEIIDDPHYESCYCMELDELRKLEPVRPFRFLNHSCDPNCEIVGYDDEPDDLHRLWLVSIRTIEPREELCIDYGWPAESAIPCRCGSDNCRGWIVDRQELGKVQAVKTGR